MLSCSYLISFPARVSHLPCLMSHAIGVLFFRVCLHGEVLGGEGRKDNVKRKTVKVRTAAANLMIDLLWFLFLFLLSYCYYCFLDLCQFCMRGVVIFQFVFVIAISIMFITFIFCTVFLILNKYKYMWRCFCFMFIICIININFITFAMLASIILIIFLYHHAFRCFHNFHNIVFVVIFESFIVLIVSCFSWRSSIFSCSHCALCLRILSICAFLFLHVCSFQHFHKLFHHFAHVVQTVCPGAQCLHHLFPALSVERLGLMLDCFCVVCPAAGREASLSTDRRCVHGLITDRQRVDLSFHMPINSLVILRFCCFNVVSVVLWFPLLSVAMRFCWPMFFCCPGWCGKVLVSPRWRRLVCAACNIN